MEKTEKLLGFIPSAAAEYARKCFKSAVFGVKNNFVLAGILLIGYCVIAPAVFVTGTIDRNITVRHLWDIMGIYSLIAAYVGGLLIPAVMFSYVHKRRDRDFYHSMPIRRGQYFIGYFCAGFVMFAVPYLLMCVVMGVLGGNIAVVFDFVVQSLALYVIIYATVTFSIMFSGSQLSSFVTLIFLNIFPSAVVYCSLLLAEHIDTSAYSTLLEPYAFILTPLSGGYAFYDLSINKGLFGWILWVQLAIAVIELVLAYIMYKYRKGETTMAVAFPKTRYILQYGVMFIVALFCTSVISSTFIFVSSYRTNVTTEGIVWTVIMTFVTFVLMNMILEQSFRAAFHRIRHLIIFAGAYAVVLALIISVVNSMPYFVIPIKTDLVVIRQYRYITTYDKPDDYDNRYTLEYEGAEYAADYVGYGLDENGREVYTFKLSEDYYVVADPEQVWSFTKRVSDYKNSIERFGYYYPSYDEVGKEYYYVTAVLCTMRPGKGGFAEGMYLDDMEGNSSRSYNVYLDYMTASDMEELKSGIDMIKADYRYYGW